MLTFATLRHQGHPQAFAIAGSEEELSCRSGCRGALPFAPLPSPKQVLRKFDSQGIQVTVNRLIYHFLQRARTVIERIRGITTAPISAT